MLFDINKLATELYVSPYHPPGRSEVHLTRKKGVVTALVNLRPFFNLNIVHYSLFSRIKKLQEKGIKVIFLLYDNTVLLGKLSEEIQTESDVVSAMDYIYDAAIRFGIDTGAIEVIPESIIWKCSNYNSSILGDLVRLAYSIGEQGGASENTDTNPINYYLDIMLGITYEGLLKPDFVFFSGKEVETWRQVRSRTSLSNIYGSDYLPPIILNIPDIVMRNSPQLISTKETDDLFAKQYSSSDLGGTLQSCSDQYLESVGILSKIEGLDESRLDLVIETIRGRMYV